LLPATYFVAETLAGRFAEARAGEAVRLSA
jgi:hypothetical protein